MKCRPFPLFAAAILLIAGCTQNTVSSQSATRMATPEISVWAKSPEQRQLQLQADALGRMSGDMVRKSTTKGAAIGAVVGCGMTLISASNASKCVAGAATGAVAGAVRGQIKGKRAVRDRVALVSASDMVRSIRKTDDKLGAIRETLPAYLARQNAELALLKSRRASNQISPKEYDARLAAIRDSRARLALALSETAENADVAAQNLQKATAHGQTGLNWHIGTAKKLGRDATSTRSTIQLL